MFGYLYKHKKIAFSLAEMLLVMFILTLMMLAIPPVTKKMFATKTLNKQHGRFECYYDNAGNLKQYMAYEGEPEHEPDTVSASDGCKFVPPTNALYFMIHAVGGGGAGADVADNLLGSELYQPTTYHAVSYLGASSVGLWPEWFKYIMQHNPKNENDCGTYIETCRSDSYEVKRTFKMQDMPYGLGGDSGERISMFFPKLPTNTEIILKPGRGGQNSGANGETSRVYFKETNSTEREVITAAGGVGGGNAIYNYSASINGGKATDFGVGNFQSVRMKSSTFESVLENNSDELLKSKINSPNADNCNSGSGSSTSCRMPVGWGGNGSYFYLREGRLAGINIYQVNNYKLDSVNYGQDDNWRVVTDKLPLTFYNRDGSNGNCTLGSSEVEVDGFCTQSYNSTFNCKITFNNVTKSLSVPKAENGKPDIPATFAEGYKDCTATSINRFTCKTTGTVENSRHSCTANNNDTGKYFTCPDIPVLGGVVQNSTYEGYGKCNFNSGGDGAIIILW